MIDIDALIKRAKLGRDRKDAQVDMCSVFATALYDVLKARDINCTLYTASCNIGIEPRWYHSVVSVYGKKFDSMGEFSAEIYRARAKIHPGVSIKITYTRDRPDDIDPEEQLLYDFFVKALNKAF